MKVDWVAVAAIAGAVTALGTVAMAVAVIVTAMIASRTLNAARADSTARTRPTLVADLRREPLSQGVVQLVLRNLGASVAYDVRVTFEPGSSVEPQTLPDSDMWKWLYLRYATPIPTWAPGWTLSNVVRAGDDPLEPLVVHVDYRGYDGTEYKEEFRLMPDHILKETMVSPSKSKEPLVLEQQKVSALQALVRTLRAG